MTTTTRRPARKVWTLDELRERSLTLDEQRGGGMWAVHFVEEECDPTTGELVELTVEVDSARDAFTRYTVTYFASSDWASCGCPAGVNGAPCHHAGKAIRYGRDAAESYSPAVRSEAERESYLAWINEPPSAAL